MGIRLADYLPAGHCRRDEDLSSSMRRQLDCRCLSECTGSANQVAAPDIMEALAGKIRASDHSIRQNRMYLLRAG